VRVRRYVYCVVDCPYKCPVDPQRLAAVAARLAELRSTRSRWATRSESALALFKPAGVVDSNVYVTKLAGDRIRTNGFSWVRCGLGTNEQNSLCSVARLRGLSMFRSTTNRRPTGLTNR